MAYRLRITAGEPAADGNIHLDAFVETDRGGDFQQVQNGHFTMVLTGDEVLAITQGAGTVTQKRQALMDLLRQRVIARGVDKSDDAITQLLAILPGGSLPVTVLIR